jgi:hypothetical protein
LLIHRQPRIEAWATAPLLKHAEPLSQSANPCIAATAPVEVRRSIFGLWRAAFPREAGAAPLVGLQPAPVRGGFFLRDRAGSGPVCPRSRPIGSPLPRAKSLAGCRKIGGLTSHAPARLNFFKAGAPGVSLSVTRAVQRDPRTDGVSPGEATHHHGRTNQRGTPNERVGRAQHRAVHQSLQQG